MEHNGCLPCAEKPVIGFILSLFCGVPVFIHSVSSVLIVSCRLSLYFSSSLSRRSYAFLFSPPPHEGHIRRGSHSWSIRRTHFVLQEYVKYVVSNFCCLVLSRTLCEMINIIWNKQYPDFRLATLCRWGLQSTETFRSVRYVTDVSGPYWLHLQVLSTPQTILLGPLDPWKWDRYVVPKRRARTTDLRRATSQKSQDLKRR